MTERTPPCNCLCGATPIKEEAASPMTADADRMAKIRNVLKWAQDYLSRFICEPTAASLPEASDLADDIWELLQTWEAK